jgi:hypothetical protein
MTNITNQFVVTRPLMAHTFRGRLETYRDQSEFVELTFPYIEYLFFLRAVHQAHALIPLAIGVALSASGLHAAIATPALLYQPAFLRVDERISGSIRAAATEHLPLLVSLMSEYSVTLNDAETLVLAKALSAPILVDVDVDNERLVNAAAREGLEIRLVQL